MEPETGSAISVEVGEQIRRLRLERGGSIRALARASGLSANALSMIERGRTSPSVSTLYKVADALGVPITSLFSTGPQRQTVVFRRAAERTRVPFPRGLWEGLGGELFAGRVEPFALTLESGTNSGPFPMVHAGHEFVYCLRGRLEYKVEQETYLLEAGDSLLFMSKLQHRWRNPGNTVTQAVFVLSGFEDGLPHGSHHIAAAGPVFEPGT